MVAARYIYRSSLPPGNPIIRRPFIPTPSPLLPPFRSPNRLFALRTISRHLVARTDRSDGGHAQRPAFLLRRRRGQQHRNLGHQDRPPPTHVSLYPPRGRRRTETDGVAGAQVEPRRQVHCEVDAGSTDQRVRAARYGLAGKEEPQDRRCRRFRVVSAWRERSRRRRQGIIEEAHRKHACLLDARSIQPARPRHTAQLSRSGSSPPEKSIQRLRGK